MPYSHPCTLNYWTIILNPEPFGWNPAHLFLFVLFLLLKNVVLEALSDIQIFPCTHASSNASPSFVNIYMYANVGSTLSWILLTALPTDNSLNILPYFQFDVNVLCFSFGILSRKFNLNNELSYIRLLFLPSCSCSSPKFRFENKNLAQLFYNVCGTESIFSLKT
jgi:hypothetical protein